MSKAGLWIKMLTAYIYISTCTIRLLILSSGGVMCIGGPALIYYVTPTEEELFKANPAYRPFVTMSTNPKTSGTTLNFKNGRWRTGGADRKNLTISLEN